ncbi:unnamed protein product, partial [Ectocarpus sp. 13 AM-2016]
QGLWVGSEDLFHEAVNDFLAEPENQRFEDDFSFHEGKPVACRIWARHLNFKGPNAVATMKAAGDAVAAIGIEPVPFVFATEYIFAEQYAATTREITFSMIATAVSTTVIGYLFLGRVALACILALTVDCGSRPQLYTLGRLCAFYQRYGRVRGRPPTSMDV